MTANENHPPAKPTLAYVDIAKGICIILVVMWHFGPSEYWPGFWEDVSRLVYKFHMPLFMFLSGYLFVFDVRGKPFMPLYKNHLHKKVNRLLLPYFSITLVFIVLKLAGQIFLQRHPVSLQTLANTFILPDKSPAPLLWFIYVLMMIFVIFPLVQYVLRNDLLLIGFSLGVFFLPGTNLFALNLFLRFFLIFVLGWYARKTGIIDNILPWPGMLLSAACFAAVCLTNQKPFLAAEALVALAGALSGIFACIFLGILLDRGGKGAPRNWMSAVGRHSPAIYLLHLPFTWFVPVLLHQHFGITDARLMWGLPPALLFGLGFPIAIELFLSKHSPILSMLLLGTQSSPPLFCRTTTPRTPLESINP